MRVKIGDFVLCDGVNELPTNLSVDQSRETQVAQGLRWTKKKVFDRQNKQTTVTFEVIREHDNFGAAQDYIISHGLAVPNNGLVEFRCLNGTSRWLQASSCQTLKSNHTGNTTFHTYSLVGGEISATKPNPNP